MNWNLKIDYIYRIFRIENKIIVRYVNNTTTTFTFKNEIDCDKGCFDLINYCKQNNYNCVIRGFGGAGLDGEEEFISGR